MSDIRPVSEGPRVYTIPQFADRIGVSAAALRGWIKSGCIGPPKKLPATGERVFSPEAADRIELWYMKRAASGGTRGPGAKERRERASEWLQANGHEADVDDQPAAPPKTIAPAETASSQVPSRTPPRDSPAAVVTREIRKWLELEDDLLPVVPLVVAVANRLLGPPVWLMIVAPPASGKTEVIQGISSLKGVYAISQITPKTFASGMLGSADG